MFNLIPVKANTSPIGKHKRGVGLNQVSQNIILIGMMGTGKTTVGRLVAERLGFQLLDLDAEIERMEGRTIPEMFAEEGEAYFRKAESRALHNVLAAKRLVIATGGGAVLNPDNCAAMKQGGWVAALTADAETIIERVRGDANRPLLAGDVEERVRRIMAEREDKYRFADVTIDTVGRSADEVATEILTHYRG
ncbi:shikimate kinase [Paenibacillus sp. 7541]|uniref:Shikimate kinase n=1 Tax=Paenibacillus campinasensis TaxID=66347 RepID=A0A268F3Y6_9BACL|nr:AAA family ATPase [Paenibacillus campinasensis]PAD80085.1 shikimate kinase [Paenibacillus campinasensis]PAK55567.1 shikimate kinase [Paenibacillus sp. 7541]